MTVGVIGANGNNARSWTDALLSRGLAVRQLVRDPKPVTREQPVEQRRLDLDDLSTYQPALEGLEVLALVTPSDPKQVVREAGLIDAARRQGVGRIVKLSAVGAELGTPISRFASWHGETERALRASKIACVILRANFFMQNVLRQRTAILSGTYLNPHGDAAAGYVDVLDIADVAAVAALGGHDGSTLTLTGPHLVRPADIRATLATVTSREISMVSPDPPEWRTMLLEQGVPEWFADAQRELAHNLNDGRASHISELTTTVAQLTGRPARTLRDFAGREFGQPGPP